MFYSLLSGLYLSLGLDSGWASIGLMDGYLGLGLVGSILGLFRFHWVWCGFECLVLRRAKSGMTFVFLFTRNGEGLSV